MRSAPWRVGLGAVLVALTTLVGTPAHAVDEVTIDHVEVTNGVVNAIVSTDGLQPGATVDPGTIRVTVDDTTAEAEAKTFTAGGIERTTILVLDASLSMKGAKFAAATTALNAFISAAPDDVKVGLVEFAGSVAPPVPPTADHASVSDALQGIKLRRGTAVYDAVEQAIESAGPTGARSLLLLSDGVDVSSDTTFDALLNSAKESGVIVDVVSLAKPAKMKELSRLAEETNGSVIPADPDALNQVFAARADALARQLLVTFPVPEGANGDASLSISLDVDGTRYEDGAVVALGSNIGVKVVQSGKALVSKPVMLVGALGLVLGLTGLLVVVLGSGDSRTATQRRLDAYLGGGSSSGGKRSKDSTGSDLRGSAVAITERVVSKSTGEKIAQRLAGAGSALNSSEWVLLHAGIAIGAAFLGFIMDGVVLALIALILGIIGPWFYLKVRHSRRLNAFNGQLAETLGLMAGGLQAGLSLPQSVDTVVREGIEPMAGELRRALVEQQLGVEITDALANVGERMESEDFGWVVMAIRIQREVGGNLAEILHTVADTLREREYLRRQVKALSAEGRLSGYILGGLPPVLFVYMYFANNEYVRVLYTRPLGFVLLGAAVLLLGIGGLFMSKLAKVEV